MTASEPSVPPDALTERIEGTKQRLVSEFQSLVSARVIDEIARQSFASYRNATVPDFVPLFVERETRERLQAQLR
jgi:hypothetical protein